MKLRINRASDLSSFSVLPPHLSRTGNLGATGSEGVGKGPQAMASQQQSQQSFSQGVLLSQLSQSSFEENLAAADQRFGSQERENSSKRISTLAPIASAQDECQLQLSRTSNNVFRRWNSSTIPDNRCQVNEEFHHRFRLMESSLNRMGLILDSVQSDVIQINRATKEVSLETEGVRQRMMFLENSVQQLLKGEEDIKATLDGRLKPIPDQVIKEFNCNKLNEIESAISALPQQIEAHLMTLQHEVCRAFTKELEVIASAMKSWKSNHIDTACLPAMHVNNLKTNPLSIKSPMNGSYIAMQRPLRNQMSKVTMSPIEPPNQKGWTTVSKMDTEFPRLLKPKLTDRKPKLILKKEEISLGSKEKDFRVVIDSDEESDGGASCLLVKKETGRGSYLIEEAREETMRILRKARKRRRRQNNPVILV